MEWEKLASARPVYRDGWLRIVGVPMLTAFGYYLTYNNIRLNTLFVYEVLSDALKVWIVWEVFRWIIRRLDRRLPWLRGLPKRLAWQLPLTCLAGLLTLTVLVHIEYAWIRPYSNQHFFDFDLVIALIFLVLLNVLYVSLYYYDSYVRSQQEKGELSAAVQQILEKSQENALGRPEHLLVRVGKREIVVPFEEIACLYSEEKETYLLTREDKIYLVDASLDKLEEELTPAFFFRANRKYILTPKVVEAVKPNTYGKVAVQLRPHPRLPEQIMISRDKAPAFRQWLKE